MEEHFSSLYESSLFKCMVTVLDVLMWPSQSVTKEFVKEMIEMIIYFKNLSSTGPTEVNKILVEWVVLKSYILLIISNNKKSHDI